MHTHRHKQSRRGEGNVSMTALPVTTTAIHDSHVESFIITVQLEQFTFVCSLVLVMEKSFVTETFSS